MPNYSLVINSKFKPFEFDELIKPVLMAEQQHREIEDAYGTLSEKASIWEGMTNPEVDKEAYDMYTGYKQALDEAAASLVKEGLTPTSRQKMLNLKSRYSKDILPIENAYKAREEERKRQKEAFDKSGGNIVFSRDAATASLDEYLRGKNQSYDQTNLEEVLKYGMLGGKSISERNIRQSEVQKFNGDYFDLVTRKGYTPKEAINILTNTNRYPEFTKFIQDELKRRKATGPNNVYSENDANRIAAALYEGLNIGIMHGIDDKMVTNWREQATTKSTKSTKDYEEPTPAFTTSIPLGGSSNVTEENKSSLDRLEGLRRIGRGASTNLADKYVATRDKAQKELQKFEKMSYEDIIHLYGTRSLRNSKPNANIIQTFKDIYDRKKRPYDSRTALAKAYNKYKELRDTYEENNKLALEEKQWLEKIGRAYSAYGNDLYDHLNHYKNVASKQSVQQNYVRPLNLVDSKYGDVKSQLSRFLSTQSAKLQEYDRQKNTYKDVSAETAQSILDDKNSLVGVYNMGKDIFLGITDADGTIHKMSNVKAIDNANRKMTNLNKLLGDFGKRTKGNIYEYTPNNNISSLNDLLIDMYTKARNAGKVAKPYKGFETTTVTCAGETYNIVSTDGELYVQTLSDELANDGKNRESIINSIAEGVLNDLNPGVNHATSEKQETN